jgi:CRISPR/Cas system-associated exonuclease Cas4 (RecB family)
MAALLHQKQQLRLRQEVEEEEEWWIRHQPPLVVPVAPQFDLNAVNEVFCIEFFW